MLFKYLIPVALSTSALAATTPSLCDKYTQALFNSNTAKDQYTLLTALVNTVVIGNYTQPNVGISVPGILAPGTYNGEDVNLLPYFNGCLKSSNRGDRPVAINFLDDGGAAPLMNNMPANSQNSAQYFLLTHLYTFFGKLLGCSTYGSAGFPAYNGDPSMYRVHKFMDLDAAEVGWFVQNVGLAAASFGVSDTDVATVGSALMSLFGYRCSPPTAVTAGAELQSICIAKTCPVDPKAQCNLYAPYYKEPESVCQSGYSSGGGDKSESDDAEEDEDKEVDNSWSEYKA